MRPVCLIILDGFGLSSETEGNAIAQAKKPVFDQLYASYPVVALAAAEQNVGLSFGEMGNSEVGHLGLGSGQVIYQSLPRVNLAIEDKSFFQNEAFLAAIDHVKKKKSTLHLLGLCSNGGIHAHIDHLHALLQLCRDQKVQNIRVHAILDGRDTKPDAGINFITTLQDIMQTLKVGKIASLSGRYYAMDRDNRWDRIEAAYRAMVHGEGKARAEDPLAAIKASYEGKVFDEEFIPTVLEESGSPIGMIQDHDAVIFFNFREDRARQLAQAFIAPAFSGFAREKVKDLFFVTMMEYEKGTKATIAFPPVIITHPLARLLADAKRKQYHIAETEKYAHVTYFFNGGEEEAFAGEDRDLVPSPSVASYDETPAMSAEKVTEKLVNAINAGKHDFYLVNYANPDMVGHTGNFQATIKAIEAVDGVVGKVIDAMRARNGVVFITADHGNAEVLLDPVTGKTSKSHTTNPVPLFMIDDERKREKTQEEIEAFLLAPQSTGILADVAPTILEVMKIKKHPSMTGKSLLPYLE